MQHLNTCSLIAEADRVLCHLVMFLTVFFYWMYKMKSSCYQDSSVFHSWFVYSAFVWEMHRLSKSLEIRVWMASFSKMSLLTCPCSRRKGRYTIGDKLQQHVAATRCSDKSLRVYWRNLWKSLSLQQNFVAATSRTDSVWFDFLRLVAATKFCCGDKDFHKNSPVHTMRFVAATCRLTLLLQLVARPVHMEWYVAATCCCNLSLSVYRP